MKDKVTIHDVARAAGVSAATVSYVINEREDQSISEETKQKVWHVINLLNYKPSVFAKNLRTAPQSKLIAVCTGELNPVARAEYLYFLENLSSAFSQNYGLLFYTNPCRRFDNADAIIAYNVTKDNFYAIGNKNYIPLIAVDCAVDDALFFQITTDYAKLKSAADSYFGGDYKFVCITPSDESLQKEIKSIFQNVIFVDTYDDLTQISAQSVLATHSAVAAYFKRHGAQVYPAESVTEAKIRQITQCIEKALSHEPFDIHSYKV